ncbi:MULTISPECIES: transposase [unclassified Enterococcus]|uniref:transposase n=1 Tax=unclassified Enterococcus TaxID=2608891 RepID=UPI000A3500CC|nr:MULTISPECIES: transposase [unclassified Enterococcus]
MIPRVFPQAKLVIDRFHFIQHLNRAFNTFRIKKVTRLRQENKHDLANKLKSNWRFLLNEVFKIFVYCKHRIYYHYYNYWND